MNLKNVYRIFLKRRFGAEIFYDCVQFNNATLLYKNSDYSYSAIYEIVKEFEDEGLIERKTFGNKKYIEHTEKGRLVLKQLLLLEKTLSKGEIHKK